MFVLGSCSQYFAITWFTLNSGIDGCITERLFTSLYCLCSGVLTQLENVIVLSLLEFEGRATHESLAFALFFSGSHVGSTVRITE